MNVSTSLPVIALVSRIATRATDRLTGGRIDHPHLTAWAAQKALKKFSIDSVLVYGHAAWVEVMEDSKARWAGFWDKPDGVERFWIWLETQYGEVVDLNVSSAHRKAGSTARFAPPMLWSVEVPKFYKYVPLGEAQFDFSLAHEKNWATALEQEIGEKCDPSKIVLTNPEFPNEPILCPGRKLLDDTEFSFKHYDRAISVYGIPDCPI